MRHRDSDYGAQAAGLLDHESILSRSGLWAKILGEEPLFSCMGLSFEERFGNVAQKKPGGLRPIIASRWRTLAASWWVSGDGQCRDETR